MVPGFFSTRKFLLLAPSRAFWFWEMESPDLTCQQEFLLFPTGIIRRSFFFPFILRQQCLSFGRTRNISRPKTPQPRLGGKSTNFPRTKRGGLSLRPERSVTRPNVKLCRRRRSGRERQIPRRKGRNSGDKGVRIASLGSRAMTPPPSSFPGLKPFRSKSACRAATGSSLPTCHRGLHTSERHTKHLVPRMMDKNIAQLRTSSPHPPNPGSVP